MFTIIWRRIFDFLNKPDRCETASMRAYAVGAANTLGMPTAEFLRLVERHELAEKFTERRP